MILQAALDVPSRSLERTLRTTPADRSPGFRSLYSRAFPEWGCSSGLLRFRPGYSGGAAPVLHRLPVIRGDLAWAHFTP